MNKGFILVPVSFLLQSVLPAQTDTLRIANMEALWKIAAEKNATQKVYGFKKEQDVFEYKASTGFLYPQAGVSFAGQDNLKLSTTPVPGELLGQPGKTLYLQFGKKFTYSTGVTVSKTLFDWQQLLQSKLAKENIALTNAQQQGSLQTLKTQIGQYYYSLLIANAALAIARNDLLIADSVLQITNQKFKEGLTDAAAVNTALINYNTVQQNMLQSNELKNQATANIKMQAGLTANSVLITSELVDEKVDEPAATTLGSDKTLLVYPYNITIADLQRKVQHTAFYPKLSVAGYWGYQQFRDDLSMSFAKAAWTDYRYLGLNFSWPIFTGFTNSNKLKAAVVQQKITAQQYKDAAEQSKINDDALLDTYNSYMKITRTTKNTFQLYAANLVLFKQKYQQGLISIDVYFKSLEDYFTAENAYLNSLSNLLTVKASLLARQ